MFVCVFVEKRKRRKKPGSLSPQYSREISYQIYPGKKIFLSERLVSSRFVSKNARHVRNTHSRRVSEGGEEVCSGGREEGEELRCFL